MKWTGSSAKKALALFAAFLALQLFATPSTLVAAKSAKTLYNEAQVAERQLNKSKKQQEKLSTIFHYIEKFGLRSVIPHLKKLSGSKLWEIKVSGKNSIRIIYVIPRNFTVLVLHGFIKKSQKTPKKEIRTAKKRYQVLLDD